MKTILSILRGQLDPITIGLLALVAITGLACVIAQVVIALKGVIP
jgi:hypothetical protein